MSIPPIGRATWLALSADLHGKADPAPWIGAVLALGTRVSRYAHTLSNRQLVVVLSVPARDFAAALVGCGWTLARPSPKLEHPLDVMRHLTPDTPVRIINDKEVLTDYFRELDESQYPARIHLSASRWQVGKVRAITALSALDEPCRQARPMPGSVSQMARLSEAWDDRLCCPPADLAIVGTRTWLRDEFSAYLSKATDGKQVPDQLSSILLPEGRRTATWSTRLYSSAGFADTLPLPQELNAVILDGAGAIKYLSEIETPVVFAILDRSVADETAAEILLQVRSRGRGISVSDVLDWPPIAGIETLAFTVAL